MRSRTTRRSSAAAAHPKKRTLSVRRRPRHQWHGSAGAPTGAMLGKILGIFLSFSNTVKLYHWRTRSYAEHKATDELYGSIDKHIDQFIEVLLGKFNGEANIRIAHTKSIVITVHNYAKKENFKAEVEKFRAFLIGLDNTMKKSDSDLMSIRDDILADINKFMYLMTLE